ncbi:MAG: hypothetical protein CNC05_02315 [Pelagibacterales bacterium MED-G42]|nr:MAG: hypothetical protein CNC05_02315 [Pelagibacterales bacterium MED-G42]|tara:strand:- start:103 stop:492 length:390 start_codon:yes stop_codon:yes gene_type:complete
MIENLIQNLIAISLGAMIFFSFIVAPVIFKVLDAVNAGKFVRKIFPFYYMINLIILSLVVILFIYNSQINTDFYLVLFLALLFAFLLFILMPMINKFKDNNEDKKFDFSHKFSVILNFVQMVGLIYLLI